MPTGCTRKSIAAFLLALLSAGVAQAYRLATPGTNTLQALVDSIQYPPAGTNQGGGTIFLPAGVYTLTNTLDLTGRGPFGLHRGPDGKVYWPGDVALEIEGTGGTIIRLDTQGKPGIDLSVSHMMRFKNIRVENVSANVGFLMARLYPAQPAHYYYAGESALPALMSAGFHVFENVHVSGSYPVAAVYQIGSEMNRYYGCTFANSHSNGDCFVYSGKNFAGVTSPSRSIPPADYMTSSCNTDLLLDGCRFEMDHCRNGLYVAGHAEDVRVEGCSFNGAADTAVHWDGLNGPIIRGGLHACDGSGFDGNVFEFAEGNVQLVWTRDSDLNSRRQSIMYWQAGNSPWAWDVWHNQASCTGGTAISFYPGANLSRVEGRGAVLTTAPWSAVWFYFQQVGNDIYTRYFTEYSGGTSAFQRVYSAPGINHPPSVWMTNPPPGTVRIAPAAIELGAAVLDGYGETVKRVEFYRDGAPPVLLGSDTTSPYRYVVSNVTAGLFAYYAAVVDNGTPAYTNLSSSVTVTVAPTPCASPVFTPPAGVYPGPRWVAIGSATPNALFRYTTDGSEPSPDRGTLYRGAFLVTSGSTVRALAYEAGMDDSGVTTGSYSFVPVAAGASRGGYDPSWTNRLTRFVFYEGDSAGTVCQDIFINASNGLQTTNYNGQGLKLKFAASDGVPERPGYIRFENFLGAIPARAFVVEAILRLTANEPSTGVGALKVAARGDYGFQETNATYATGGGNVALASRTSIAGGGKDQLWAGKLDATLTSNAVVDVDITPALRAWLDHERNAAWGWPNQGLAMNINPSGSSVPGGTVSFFDSEAADTNNRPRLIVTCLPVGCGYAARLYQPVAEDTEQIKAVTVQDTFIWRDNQGQGQMNLFTNNYGGQLGLFAPTLNDPSSLLLRWVNLSPPAWKKIVDARLRVGGSDLFTTADSSVVNWEIRKCLKPWVEGSGSKTAGSKEGVTYTNFNALPPDLTSNRWQAAGATGVLDSVVLFTLNGLACNMGEVLAGGTNSTFMDLAADWFEGGTNEGILIRGNNTARVSTPMANVGGGEHNDPYLSPGLLVILKDIPAGGAVIILH